MEANNYDSSIRIRCNKKQKEDWKKFIEEKTQFDDLSKFFRYLADSYILGDLIEKKMISNTDVIMEIKQAFEDQQTETEKIRSQIDKIYDTIYQESKNRVSESLRGKILTLLSKSPYTTDEIVKVLDIEESEIYDNLAFLINKKLVSFNNKGEYFIEN